MWFLWSVLSLGWADDELAALRWTSFMAMMIGLAIAIAIICRDRRRAKILLWSLLGAFILACLIALAEVATGHHLPTFRQGREGRTGLIGVGSLFGNQNNFAVFLSLALPYLAVLPVVYRDVRLRMVGIAGSAAALLLILATGSKSGLLAAGLVILGLLLLVGTDRRERGRLIVAGAIAALAVVLVFTVHRRQRARQARQPHRHQAGLRPAGGPAPDAAGLGRRPGVAPGRRPRTWWPTPTASGVGAGNAETHVRSLADFPGVANLHDWWLEVLVNGGVVGFALYLLFYLTLLRRQTRAARRTADPLVRYMCLAGTLSLVGWVIGSIGPSTAIHFAPMWIVFGLGMGALVLAAREAQASRGAEGRPSGS